MTLNKGELFLYNLDDLKRAAKILLKEANTQKKWCLYGTLGSGKTSLIQAICQCLEVQEPVTSPTYSLVNEYLYLDAKDKKERSIYHLDLYRLKNIEEAIDIGIEEYLYNDFYCFIEWPEVIEPILPKEVVKINLEITADPIRKMYYS